MAIRHITHTDGHAELSGGPNTRVEPVTYFDDAASPEPGRELWTTAANFHNVFPGDQHNPVLFGTLAQTAVSPEVQIVPPNENGEQ